MNEDPTRIDGPDLTRTGASDPGPGSHATALGRVGPYALVRRLGEGGMGVVFEARQEVPVRRTVALKLIRAGLDTEHFVTRFESERQALALMDHPGIAKVLDAGATEDGLPYFVMEFVAGEPINDFCDRTRMALDDRLRLFAAVCDAVHHAHQKGVIHRDIKPSNILVTLQDGEPVPKVIDFGVAKAVSQPLTDRPVATMIGAIVGTPLYMAPEQIDGASLDVDTRADVYSLGALLLELFTGEPPITFDEYSHLTLETFVRRTRETDAPRPSQRIGAGDASLAARLGTDPSALSRRLRGDLDWIVLKALEKDRARRYQSAAEFAQDIRRHLRDEPVLAGSPSRAYRARKFIRRHRVGVVAATFVVLALVLGVVAATAGLVRARRAEAAARHDAATSASVVDFLEGLFEVSDPGEARGNSITAREILDRGSKRIGESLASEPIVRARLLNTMGTVYRSLGLYKDSLPLLQESAKLYESAAGPDDPQTIAAQDALMGLRLLSGDTDGIAPVLDELVARSARVTGPDSLETARAVNNLAAYHLRRKEFVAAIPDLERVLAIREERLGPQHGDVAKTLNNLGLAYTEVGDFQKARDALERAVAIRTSTLGADHLDTGKALVNLGRCLDKLGDRNGARERLSAAVAIFNRTLGADHPLTKQARANLELVSK